MPKPNNPGPIVFTTKICNKNLWTVRQTFCNGAGVLKFQIKRCKLEERPDPFVFLPVFFLSWLWSWFWSSPPPLLSPSSLFVPPSLADYIHKVIRANAIYEGRYLLGTSIARPCIGKRQIEICRREEAGFVSHGSTGKGNDQVRFELCYLAMAPDIECVTLWRDREYLDKFKGRLDLIDYAESMNIPVGATKEFSYSEDENMFHISYESGELEDPAYPGHAVDYPGLVLKKKSVGLLETPDVPARLTIDFKEGTPSRVFNVDTQEEYTDSLSMFHYLNQIGGQHGVGRIDIVENRFVGMKSRGCYETPGGTILHAAHLDLECLTMDREVMRIRDGLSLKYTELVYNGYGCFCSRKGLG